MNNDTGEAKPNYREFNWRDIKEWGVDYVRLTYQGREGLWRVEEVADAYASFAMRYGREVGGEMEAWSWQGYKGIKVGSYCAGFREGSAILQVSGCDANEPGIRALPWTNVPRLDIQLTIEDDDPDATIERAARIALHTRLQVEGRRASVRRQQTYGEGDTLYLWKRDYERFARVYNKSAERNDDSVGLIRWELELKPGASVAAWEELEVSCDVGRVISLMQVCLERWGYEFDTKGYNPVAGVSRETKVAPTLLSRLRWLERSVAPTCVRLMQSGVSRELLERILFPEKSYAMDSFDFVIEELLAKGAKG